jgi:hypothetical protein
MFPFPLQFNFAPPFRTSKKYGYRYGFIVGFGLLGDKEIPVKTSIK